MPLDPYQLCPCGSGKKLKFCCAPLTEVMEKVQAAQDKGNTRLAQQLIEKQYDPEKPVAWACVAHASMLIEQGEILLARQVLQTLLKQNPEHPAGIGLYAMTAALTGKFQESKSVIYNVFQSGAGLLPDLASEVASAVSAHFARQQCWMAARAYLVLSMRLAPKEAKQDCFYELMSFDANYAIPYPFRSGQPLTAFTGGDDAEKKEDRKAHKLAELGCYAPAARIYVKLIEKHPENALLHVNAGLCQAWDGEEAQAAHYLNKAAELTEDVGRAVELETLSQLMAWNCVEDRAVPQTAHYNVASISKLMSILSDADRAQRVTEQQSNFIGDWTEAGYELLDRKKLDNDAEGLKPEDIPLVIGEILILKETPELADEKRVVITGESEERLEDAISLVKEILGDKLQLEDESRDDSLPEFANPGAPREHEAFFWRWSFPAKFPAKPRMDLFLQKWENLAYNEWPGKPQSILDGKAPKDLPADSVRKYAAAHVFDALAGQRQLPLDLPRLYEVLGLKPLPTVKPDDEHPLSSLTAMQFNRLDYSDLGDDDMLNVMNRALLTHYSQVLEKVLEELLEHRPGCEGKFDRFRAYRTLSQIAVFKNDEAGALRWIGKALDEATKLDDSFEPVFEWKVRKLTVLLRDPHRAEVSELIHSMHGYYGAKIPQFRQMIENLQSDLHLDVGILTADAAPATNEGLWSPDQPPAGGEKKLWLPGQD
ncbi:MAG: hypothetical protein CMJ46_15190 [Planctomyces sp.]|nr:hypothetical protein [Planctomyces sp.]